MTRLPCLVCLPSVRLLPSPVTNLLLLPMHASGPSPFPFKETEDKTLYPWNSPQSAELHPR